MTRWTPVSVSAGRYLRAMTALLCATTALVISPAVHAAAFASRLGLVTQTPFSVPADGTVEFVISVPASIDLAALPNATLRVTARRAVTTRADVTKAQHGELPRSIDSVDLPIVSLARPAADQLLATVVLETDTRTAPALQLPKPGLYPVVLEIRDGETLVAELVTLIHRLPAADESAEVPLPIAFAMSITSTVVLDDANRVVIDDGVLAELTKLADILEASTISVGVRVPPALLLAIGTYGDAGAAVAQRLAADLARNETLSAPRYPLDPSLAAAANQQDRYTQWLRDGEDDLTGFMSSLPSGTVAFMNSPLTAAGGSLLRDLGTRLIVTTAENFDTLPNSTGGYTDSTQLVQMEVAPGVTVDAALVDRDLDSQLELPTTTPTLTGIFTVANLLAYRQEIIDLKKDSNGNSIGDPSRRAVTLGTTDLALPNVDTFRAVASLLAVTPSLTPVSLAELGVRTDHLVLAGRGEVVVGLSNSVPGTLDGRIDTVSALTQETLTTGSMLPAADPRLQRWQQTIATMPTSALTDEQVASQAAAIRVELSEIRSAVELPTSFPITLTGRTTTVPFRLYNHGDVPLTVRVHMSSSKLTFPDDDVTVVVPPQSSTLVAIKIEARTHGNVPATLTVLTPSGDILAQPVPLNASVTALSGLGNLVTGAFLLVVLTWWVRHVRQSRRNRASAVAAGRHPVSSAESAPADADESELSPDAATSTLPPS